MMCKLPDYILREFRENIKLRPFAILRILTLSERCLEKYLKGKYKGFNST